MTLGIVSACTDDCVPPRGHNALMFTDGELGGACVEFGEREHIIHEHRMCTKEGEVLICELGHDGVSNDIARVSELGSVRVEIFMALFEAIADSCGVVHAATG